MKKLYFIKIEGLPYVAVSQSLLNEFDTDKDDGIVSESINDIIERDDTYNEALMNWDRGDIFFTVEVPNKYRFTIYGNHTSVMITFKHCEQKIAYNIYDIDLLEDMEQEPFVFFELSNYETTCSNPYTGKLDVDIYESEDTTLEEIIVEALCGHSIEY